VILHMPDDPEHRVLITPEALLKSLAMLVTAALEGLDQAKPLTSAGAFEAWLAMSQRP